MSAPGIRVKFISLNTSELPQITPVCTFVSPKCTVSHLITVIKDRAQTKIKEIGGSSGIFSASKYVLSPNDAIFLTIGNMVCPSPANTVSELAMHPENIDSDGYLTIKYRKESVFG